MEKREQYAAVEQPGSAEGMVLRLLAVLYAATIYLSIFGLLYLMGSKPSYSRLVYLEVLLAPLEVLIAAGIYLKRKQAVLDRAALLDAVILEKYLLNPLFLAGALLIAFLLLITISPLVFMIFIGPVTISILSVIGWIYMVSGLVFSLPYIRRARRDGVLNRAGAAGLVVCQFFFVLDELSFMAVAWRERRWRKTTFTLCTLVVLVIFLAIFGIIYGAANH